MVFVSVPATAEMVSAALSVRAANRSSNAANRANSPAAGQNGSAFSAYRAITTAGKAMAKISESAILESAGAFRCVRADEIRRAGAAAWT